MHGVQGSFLHFSSSHIPDIAKHAWGAGKFPTLFQCMLNIAMYVLYRNIFYTFKLHFTDKMTLILYSYLFQVHTIATHGVQECFLHCYHSIFYPLCYFPLE